jgi:hypothetical protein
MPSSTSIVAVCWHSAYIFSALAHRRSGKATGTCPLAAFPGTIVLTLRSATLPPRVVAHATVALCLAFNMLTCTGRLTHAYYLRFYF